MNEKRIKEVFSDDAFVKGFFALETPLEAQSALKEKGIELTESEIISLRDEIAKLVEKTQSGDELSLELLDEAAGGFAPIPIAHIAVAAIATIVGGTTTLGAIGIGIGFLTRRW